MRKARYLAGVRHETSLPAGNASREQRRRARFEFLATELQAGHVSASLAMTSTNPANAARYRHLARKAYNAVIRFWPTLPLQRDEDEQIRSQLASLESKMEELAQLQHGASRMVMK